jgi:hypothetical protein
MSTALLLRGLLVLAAGASLAHRAPLRAVVPTRPRAALRAALAAPSPLDAPAATTTFVEADTRPAALELLESMAAQLVEAEAGGRLRSANDEALVDALLAAIRDGRAAQLPLLARDGVGALLSPRYVSLMRQRLGGAAAGDGEGTAALLALNEFVTSLAASTHDVLGSFQAAQFDKVRALCLAATRGGNAAVHALALELREAGKLDADFVNWLALAIAAAEASDGPSPSRWQLVLKLVRQGTHALLAQDYAADVATLRLVMALPPAARRELLWAELGAMAPDGARHFEVTLRRIVGSLGYERDARSAQLRDEVALLLDETARWFDSPFYEG